MKHVLAVGVLLVAAGALALRLPQLEERPLHTDEAVHAIKFGGLWETGTYRYDPHEYHGPSLYYLSWPIAWGSGARNLAELKAGTLRLLPVLWGVGLILLLPFVADGQGRAASLWAGLFTAISPAMVFYSRYYIHELGLVFFTFLWLAAGWRYSRTGQWGWALMSGLGLGMMVATKETFVLQAAAVAGALALAAGWGRWFGGERGGWRIQWWHVAAGLGVSLGVWLVLFTSFFSNANGPLDSIRTYAPWLERAEGASPHVHPWHYYLGLLVYQSVGRGPTWSEGLILGLAGIGLVVALARGRGRGSTGGWIRFVAFYAVLLTIIYSAIPYKTPWCLLGFLHGLILLAGVGAAWVVQRSRRLPIRVGLVALVLAGAGQLTVQAYRASYTHSDNPRNPYVYAHTLGSVLGLVDRVEALALVDPRREELVIKVMAKGGDYWPLPWYLRRFERVGWWDAVAEEPAAPIVIVSPAFASELESVLGETHQMAGYYGLRPGVFLQLYVERDLWARYLGGHRGA
jgi:uncharacterized protein (TIGR03663 family)